MHYSQRNAFTFIEIAVAMVVLMVGLTASLSLMFVGLDWGRDIHLKTSVVNTTRAVIDDPLMLDVNADPLAYEKVEGYVNGLYLIREATPFQETVWTGASRSGWQDQVHDVTNLPGFYANVKVEAYIGVVGSDISTGEKVFEMIGFYYEAQR